MSIPEVDDALARAFANANDPPSRPARQTAGPSPHFRLPAQDQNHSPTPQPPPSLRWPPIVELIERKLGPRLDAAASQIAETARVRNARVILIAGPCRALGCTTIATLLSRAIARRLPPVALIDADFAAPSLAIRLNLPAGPGLDEVVRGTHALNAALTNAPGLGLSLLRLSEPVEFPRALISHPGWACLFAKLRREFPMILVDSPPLTGNAVGTMLLRSVDAAILVGRGANPRRGIEQAAEMLNRAGVPLLGVVENFA